MSDKPQTPPAEGGGPQQFYQAMAHAPDADPAMVTARAIAILHAAIRRIPEQSSPRNPQQDTTHRYI